VILPNPAFQPSAGERFGLVSGSSLSGQFKKVSGVAAAPGIHYVPSYAASSAGLLADAAGVTAEPAEGAIGSVVTLHGSGFEPGEKLKVAFQATGAKKGKTVAKAVAGPEGELSVQVTIPVKSAEGPGVFSVEGKIVGSLPAPGVRAIPGAGRACPSPRGAGWRTRASARPSRARQGRPRPIPPRRPGCRRRQCRHPIRGSRRGCPSPSSTTASRIRRPSAGIRGRRRS
jgi:hypothetical protein